MIPKSTFGSPLDLSGGKHGLATVDRNPGHGPFTHRVVSVSQQSQPMLPPLPYFEKDIANFCLGIIFVKSLAYAAFDS